MDTCLEEALKGFDDRVLTEQSSDVWYDEDGDDDSLCLIILLPTLKVTVFREAVLKHLMSLPACSAVIPISLRSLL